MTNFYRLLKHGVVRKHGLIYNICSLMEHAGLIYLTAARVGADTFSFYKITRT